MNKLRSLDNLRRDVIQSLRLLRYHYRISVAAIVTMALAIGAVTVVFSVFDAVVLRALPGSAGDRLLSVTYAIPGETIRMGFGHLELAEAKQRWTPFDTVGSYTLANLKAMAGPGGDQRVVTSVVSTTFFDLFGARPIVGRPFVEGDSAPDSERVVVLAYALWRQRFGGDPGILGQSFNFDGAPYRVVGVMPADFAMPVRWIQAWLPDVDTVSERNYTGFTHQVIARLAPGWSIDRARQALLGEPSRLARVRVAGPPVPGVSGRASSITERAAQFSLSFLRDELVGPAGFAATLLLIVVAIVMVIACVNVAMLLLARNAARQREFAVRLALGATRQRLMWQSWLDSLLFSIGGGVLGAAIAFPSLRLIRDLGPIGVPRLREAVVDGHVFGVAVAAVVVTTILTGVLPARQIRDSSLTVAMSGASQHTGHRVGIFRRFPLEGLLTTVQVALVLLLVAVASLLLRSVTRLLTIDPGFDPTGLMVLQFESPRTPNSEFSRQLMDEVRRIPGVRSVAAAAYLKSIPMMSVKAEGSPSDTFAVSYQIASSQFFSTLAIPMLEGGTFRPDEHRTDPCTVVINRTLAQAVWPGQPAVGRTIGDGRACTVVGVVGDVRFHLDADPGYQVYFSDRAPFGSADTFFIRLTDDRPGVRSTVAARATSIDPTRRIDWTGSVSDVLFDHIVTPPFYAFVFGWFAALALVLGAVGVYGMMSQLVARRWREIGVRLALGAEPADIRGMVLGRAAAMLVAGIVVGLFAAIGIGQWVGSMLYNLAPSDPASLSAACGVVLFVGLLAAFIPSQRASRVDPTVLFRVE